MVTIPVGWIGASTHKELIQMVTVYLVKQNPEFEY